MQSAAKDSVAFFFLLLLPLLLLSLIAPVASAAPRSRRTIPDPDIFGQFESTYVANDGRISCDFVSDFCSVPHNFLIQEGYLYATRLIDVASNTYPAEGWELFPDLLAKVSRYGLDEDDRFVKVLFGATKRAGAPATTYRRLYAMINTTDTVVAKCLEFTTLDPPVDGDESIAWHEITSSEGYTVPIKDIAVAQHDGAIAPLYGIPSNMSGPALFVMNDLDGSPYNWDFDYFGDVTFPTSHPLEAITVPPLVAFTGPGDYLEDISIVYRDTEGVAGAVYYDGSDFAAVAMDQVYDPDLGEDVPVTLAAVVESQTVVSFYPGINQNLEYIIGVTTPAAGLTNGYMVFTYRNHSESTTWNTVFQYVNMGDNTTFAKIPTATAVPALRQNYSPNRDTVIFGYEFDEDNTSFPLIALFDSAVWPPDFGPLTLYFAYHQAGVGSLMPVVFDSDKTGTISVSPLDYHPSQYRENTVFLTSSQKPTMLVRSSFCQTIPAGLGYLRNLLDLTGCIP